MPADNPPAQADNNPPARPSQPAVAEPAAGRWKNGLAILLLGAMAEAGVWFGLEPDRTNQVFYSMPVLSGTAFLFLLWWVFLSGIRWKWRFGGLCTTAIFVAVLASVVRVKEYSGGMLPIFEFRWQTTAEERAENYWALSEAHRFQEPLPKPLGPLKIGDDDWPEFRGRHRDGVVRGVTIRTDWYVRPPQPLWRHPVGLGWSSFAVVDGLAFTQEQRRLMEVVVCYDFDTGNELWVHSDLARFSESMGSDGPRATPTVYDGRVYALGATGILNCLEAHSGNLEWSTNILRDSGADNLGWGMAGSPLVHENVVIVTPGGVGHSVMGYDRLTGKQLWSAGDRAGAYASPQLARVADQPQILVFNGEGLAGHSVSDGQELWFREWTNSEQINAAQPVVADEQAILVGTGYGQGSVVFPIVSQDSPWSVAESPRWPPNAELKLKFSSAVASNGFVYGLDERILTCINLDNGYRQWKRGRYGFGQLLLIDDLLLIQAESGEVALVEARPDQYHEIARFQALESTTWNHPVVVRGRLLVRNAEEVACFDISQP